MTSHVHDLSSLSLDDKNFWKSCKTLERKSLQSIELLFSQFLTYAFGHKTKQKLRNTLRLNFCYLKIIRFLHLCVIQK